VDYLQRLKKDGVLEIGEPAEAAYHLVNMAIGGVRFLLNKPLLSRKARQQWAQSVLEVVLPALRQPKPASRSR
jgi:hypothetical protein